MSFVLFWCIWYRLVALQNSVQNGLKWCKSSCHEVVSDFATNAPDPPYWTLTSCFGVFHTIWLYLLQFGCITKLSAKWAKLVQKFEPRSRVGIFRNERTRSTPLDTKVTFVCVLYCLDALQNSVQNEPKWGKSLCHEDASELFTTKHPIHPIGP